MSKKKKRKDLISYDAALKSIDKSEFETYYHNNSIADVVDKFKISVSTIYKLIDYYCISNKSAEEISAVTKRSLENVDWTAAVNKSKATKINKYGSIENFNDIMVSNVKRTKLDRYGDENYNNPEKNKRTLIEHYGSLEAANKARRQKSELTLISKHGSLDEAYKERNKKINTTCLNKYGVMWTFQAEDVKEKIQKQMMDKYNVPYSCMADHCRLAQASSSNSKPNVNFEKILISNGITSIDREFSLENYSYDFKINDNILVEINPTITHNSIWCPFGRKPADIMYHKMKSDVAKKYGFRCMHIFDWDDINKILNLLICKNTLYARKLKVHDVSLKEAREFINKYHLQNYAKDSIRLGLYDDSDNLISIMTFNKPRYNSKYEYELIRYCSSSNVIGGAEKLFSHFIKLYNPSSVISYCDMSKFTGDTYIKLGFNLVSDNIKPSAHWYNPSTSTHITDNLLRQRGFDQLFGTYFGKGVSNEELMIEAGFFKVYDSGQATYVLNR